MDAFIARQPILNRSLQVEGYELLYRSSWKNLFDGADDDVASSRVVLDSLLLVGFKSLLGGRCAYVNVSRDMLVNGWYSVLPPAQTVLEILETIPADGEVMDACRRAREAGYRIALDDYCGAREREAFFPVVDVVKLDVRGMDERAVRRAAARLEAFPGTRLAEKVERHDIWECTRELGFSLFQGYFFARPVVRSCRDIPASRLTLVRILQEVHKPRIDVDAVETLIGHDLAVSYKLLRYLRSAHMGWRGEVDSIRHALLLLGEDEFRSWASLVAMAGLAGEKPAELVRGAIERGWFCRLVGDLAGFSTRPSTTFLLGLFSLLDAILDRPMETVLAEVAITPDLRDALLGRPGPLGDVLRLVVAYTVGDWSAVGPPAARLGVEPQRLPGAFASAVWWADGYDDTRAEAA